MTKPVKNKYAIITSQFGERRIPDGTIENHGGIDIAVPGVRYVPIYATCSGKVAAITDATASCGNAVFVKPDVGDYYCLYFHLDFVNPDIAVNDQVLEGDYLGTMGNTGVSRGIHLHYGHRKGMTSGTECIDPVDVSGLYA
jgi:murein DD-endopeptidase MepM/ murein hydrolase activator NlpD